MRGRGIELADGIAPVVVAADGRDIPRSDSRRERVAGSRLNRRMSPSALRTARTAGVVVQDGAGPRRPVSAGDGTGHGVRVRDRLDAAVTAPADQAALPSQS
jgi:hypothetical protein